MQKFLKSLGGDMHSHELVLVTSLLFQVSLKRNILSAHNAFMFSCRWHGYCRA